jgi:hypothetical protein
LDQSLFFKKKDIYAIWNWIGKVKLNSALVLFCFFASNLHSQNLWAWGAKGHAVICEAAIHLVKNPDLKAYLLHKTHTMSHLCNIPDIYWRQLTGTESGNSTHFIEPDLVGADLKDSPTIFEDFTTKYLGKTTVTKKNPVFSVEKEVGTLWWRADQFVRLAIENGKTAKSQSLPEKKDEKNDDHPYNKAIFNMITNMGLLGHFVGDAAQPLHNTFNYDGWENGHGGIHGYYEEMIVVHLDSQLLSEIIKNAPKEIRELDLKPSSTPIENMKKLSLTSRKDLTAVWKLDPIVVKSTESDEKGMSLKKSAKRTDASKVYKKIEPLIVKQMSRSAALLAYFWDEIYTKAQTPELEVYRGYKFPHQPEFVAPDYIKSGKN